MSHAGYDTNGTYPLGLFKSWKIRVKPNLRIKLQFEGRFDVKETTKTGQCNSSWVQVYDDSNTELLGKTCNYNANLDINGTANIDILVSTSRTVIVFFKTNTDDNPGTGFKLTRVTVPKVPEMSLPSSDQCLWGCTWSENPFYRVFTGWFLRTKRTNKLNEDLVTILFTSPQIPTDLSCLKECFNVAEEKKEQFKEECLTEGNLDGDPTNSNDPTIDCLLFKRGRRYKNNVGLRSNALNNKNIDASTTESRKRREVTNPLEDEEGLIRNFQYLIPSTPLDIALEFCILANMNKRGVLPPLPGQPTNGVFFYNNETNVFGGNDCSDFLPSIFTIKVDIVPKERNFGPSSSNVERYLDNYICFQVLIFLFQG